MSSRDESKHDRGIWKFGGGSWERASEPYETANADRDYGGALLEAGFMRAADWGWPDSSDVEVYEHHSDDRWLVVWSPFADRFHEIEVTSLPDLLDLLGKVAPVTTLSLLSTAVQELGNLILNASEDANREYDRRRPKVRRPR